IANRACKILNLDKSLIFLTQDLSLPDFRIPIANTYYLYDPFTYETYQSVLKQIVDISKTQKVKIITKGNARSWVSNLAKENNWPEPLILDEGNLCLFTTEF
ncbi:MAG: hypothetical protein NXH75_05595, partial [Halobacteriovoraceae bacterium]|nr:hypothetical protein [Halobacteriovoraceae bacterium]